MVKALELAGAVKLAACALDWSSQFSVSSIESLELENVPHASQFQSWHM